MALLASSVEPSSSWWIGARNSRRHVSDVTQEDALEAAEDGDTDTDLFLFKGVDIEGSPLDGGRSKQARKHEEAGSAMQATQQR
jgi:hypothetical protein